MQKIKKNKYSKKKILRVKKVAITKKVFFPGLFKYDRRITIRLTSNNMYCSIMNLQTRKILLTASAGKYRIKFSKKLLRKNSLRVLKRFIKDVKKLLTKSGIIITLILPKRIRKKLINQLRFLRVYRVKNVKKKLFFRLLLIKLNSLKCYNGCRSSKQRRKKRKGMRFFK